MLVTYADLLGLWGAMEGPTAAGLSIPTWVSGGMAGWGAYPDGIGGTDWCWGWNMSAAMVIASPTMGAVKVRSAVQSAKSDLYCPLFFFPFLTFSFSE